METNVGKKLTLGGREYTVVTESTPAMHPNSFAHSGAKLSLGIQGVKGALGLLTVWENSAKVLWIKGARVESFTGAVTLR